MCAGLDGARLWSTACVEKRGLGENEQHCPVIQSGFVKQTNANKLINARKTMKEFFSAHSSVKTRGTAIPVS